MSYPTYQLLTDDLPAIDEQHYKRLLNTSRNAVMYPALLAGYRNVYEAMNDTVFRNYLDVFVQRVAYAGLNIPDNETGITLKNHVLDNLFVEMADDQLETLSFNGLANLSDSLLPVLTELVDQNKPVHCVAFLVAAYGHYLQAETDDKGAPYETQEPLLHETDWAKIGDNDVLAFLDVSPLASATLRDIPHFPALYTLYRKQIAIYGVSFTLRQAMCTFWETV